MHAHEGGVNCLLAAGYLSNCLENSLQVSNCVDKALNFNDRGNQVQRLASLRADADRLANETIRLSGGYLKVSKHYHRSPGWGISSPRRGKKTSHRRHTFFQWSK